MAGRDKITWPENLFDWSTNFWGSWEGGFRREALGLGQYRQIEVWIGTLMI
jgi:hypothetical protein